MIYVLFSEKSNDQRWILYNENSGSPIRVIYNVSIEFYFILVSINIKLILI